MEGDLKVDWGARLAMAGSFPPSALSEVSADDVSTTISGFIISCLKF